MDVPRHVGVVLVLERRVVGVVDDVAAADLGVTHRPGDGVDVRVAEAQGEAELGIVVEVLAREHEHHVFEQQGSQFGHLLVGKLGGGIDAFDDGTERAGSGRDDETAGGAHGTLLWGTRRTTRRVVVHRDALFGSARREASTTRRSGSDALNQLLAGWVTTPS